MNDLDSYYLRQSEPFKGCLLALRTILLNMDEGVTEAWKFRMPFFCFHGRMFCYLWIDQKASKPYVGFVEGKHLSHPDLIVGKRTRMKIIYIDPGKDIPVKTVRNIARLAIDLYNH
jgi:hypothetical protein